MDMQKHKKNMFLNLRTEIFNICIQQALLKDTVCELSPEPEREWSLDVEEVYESVHADRDRYYLAEEEMDDIINGPQFFDLNLTNNRKNTGRFARHDSPHAGPSSSCPRGAGKSMEVND
ncbi:hypothetical protein FRC07_000523 [Ceratobasidium sp. 392]|nr:hypothetical protein FRC07_000523 [Ceratobasidium sp. 392]